MTHTRHAFVEAKWDGEFAGPPLAGSLPLVPGQEAAVFDAPGRSALRHDAGRQLAAGLNARSL